jgi:hypothetical protein
MKKTHGTPRRVKRSALKDCGSNLTRELRREQEDKEKSQ